MIIFYFTSTGNSLAVAKRIGGNLISIPQLMHLQNLKYKDDAIGIVFPIYSLEPPKMVSQFLEKVKLEADYIFAIGTYGKLSGAAMFNLQKQAEKIGFGFDYTASLLMVDNFLPVYDIDNQIAQLPKKRTEEMTAKIVEDIHNRKHTQAAASLGIRALNNILRILDNEASIGKQAQSYIINEDCNRCSVCAKVCPTGNITITDRPQFNSQCIACEACVHQCPQNAIHMKRERSSKRWRNPEVSLKEIIEANNLTKS